MANAVVLETSTSPHVKLRSIPVTAVKMRSGFWDQRMELVSEVMLLNQRTKLEPVLESFRLATDPTYVPEAKGFSGEARLYKWIEAVAWTLAHRPNPELQRLVEEDTKLLETVQSENGYINAHFPEARAEERWSKLSSMHELFAAGHLIQAAIAMRRVTGYERLFTVAVRCADHICDVFNGGRFSADFGHPEIEMALVELYRETGNRRYLDTARFFIDHTDGPRMREAFGHAVMALFFYCGMTDAYAETGDQGYYNALQTLWQSVTETKMYVTGGVGGRAAGESFGREFELPHESSYAETCANISNVMWNWRLLTISAETKYADLMELALYNSVISGMSLDGTEFFYANPHASNGKEIEDPWYPRFRKGVPARSSWFSCACCPPNLARTIASLPGYFYSTNDKGLWVHLYDNNTLSWHLSDGTGISLSQKTNYPWDGRVEMEVTVDAETEFSLFLRIPRWARTATVKVGGQTWQAKTGQYFSLYRTWPSGTSKVELLLPMPVELITANPMAAETRCSAAVTRGPIVFCFEEADNQSFSVRHAMLPVSAKGEPVLFQAEFHPELLNGVTVIKGKAEVPTEPWGYLYRRIGNEALKTAEVELTGIPYYAWSNRSAGAMTIWLPVKRRE